MKTNAVLAVVALVPVFAGAQSVAPTTDASVAAVSDTLVTVPALTPVIVRLEDEISTKVNKPGDHFKIAVAEDVRVGDVVVIPAGCAGEGEVIDAAKPGSGGKAGKLVLAARYIRVGNTEVRLRSFVLGATGKDYSNGALASSLVIGPLAMFVHGGAVIVPRDTLGGAKTTTELRLPAAAATGPPPQ